METESSVVDCTAEDMAERFQVYLRKYENDEKLVVLKAVKKGELDKCYTSTVIRILVTGMRGDGSPYTKSFIWKMWSTYKFSSSIMDLSIVFHKEGYVYNKVLPVLGPYGPACIFHDEWNVITEDLVEKGYVRYGGIYADLNHTIFTLKTLAKFHASSLALRINDPRRFDEIVTRIQETFFVESAKVSMRDYIPIMTKWMIKYIELIKPQTPALQTIANMFADRKDDDFDTFVQLLSESKQKYHTICHGDMWLNNMLFLYDDDNRLINVKFIDYQLTRFTSVASDVHFFIYTSVQSSLIENSYESLIKIYHSTLLKELRQLHVREEVLAELGKEWLEADMKTYAYYGLSMGCSVVHLILLNDEDIKKAATSKYPNFDVNIIGISKEKNDRFNCVVSHYYNRYHLGIIRDDLEPLSVAE